VRRTASPEAVADEGERDQRAEDGCAQAREGGDLERDLEGTADSRDAVPVTPVVPREALPDVVEAAGRTIEREHDDDRDRKQEIGEREQRVRRQRVPPRERERLHAPALDERLGRGRHPVSFSVPSARAYVKTSVRMIAIRMNESDAAAG